jgi:hypothetical protein
MKKINILFVICSIAVLFAMPGCSKDKSDSSSQSLTIGSTSYSFSNGYVGLYDSYDHLYEIVLTSSGISYSSSDAAYTGTGNVIYVDFYSTAVGTITGTYTYSAEDTAGIGTFVDFGYILNYNISAETYDSHGSVTDGTVTITKSGSEYEISISSTKISGTYKGTLTNLSSKKSLEVASKKFSVKGNKIFKK